MGTELCLSTVFHPQTDGQSERTIQTLEGMLRACSLEYAENSDHNLPLVDFALIAITPAKTWPRIKLCTDDVVQPQYVKKKWGRGNFLRSS